MASDSTYQTISEKSASVHAEAVKAVEALIRFRLATGGKPMSEAGQAEAVSREAYATLEWLSGKIEPRF